ncbi:hypothetical protein QWJ34_02290 [Saccharibacillus sp. CPCC 101409]|uniref:hypothetical protein n=1 Tax=Saccharibacillus sp. CPCC 101409 TaxID=3058041 RepID=UPI002671113D|nr:hypothetical protein [Saccharibacillus sp. CPCC 101409]MDO3408592.1 hypothetical protein [Saccharibacillus sp. CPCC 101409]
MKAIKAKTTDEINGNPRWSRVCRLTDAISKSIWTYIALSVILIALVILMILVIRIIVLVNGITSSAVFQACVSLVSVTIAATVSFLVLRRQIKTQKEVLQRQIEAQQEREREKEIVADQRAIIRTVDDAYSIVHRLNYNLNHIVLAAELSDLVLPNNDDIKKDFYRTFDHITMEFKNLKSDLDSIDTGSLPPGRFFTSFLKMKMLLSAFLTVIEQGELQRKGWDSEKENIAGIVKFAKLTQEELKKSMKDLIEQARPSQLKLKAKYKDIDDDIADSVALSKDPDDIYEDSFKEEADKILKEKLEKY